MSNKNNQIYQYASRLVDSGYDRGNTIKIIAQTLNYSSKSVESLLDSSDFNFSDRASSESSNLLSDMKGFTKLSIVKLPGNIINNVIVSLFVMAASALALKGL